MSEKPATTELRRRLPMSFQEATWRGVVPIDESINRMGVSFNVDDTPIRLAISPEDAQTLISALECYLPPSQCLPGFSMMELTAAVNKHDYLPQRLLEHGLFEAEPVYGITVAIEEHDGVLSLVKKPCVLQSPRVEPRHNWLSRAWDWIATQGVAIFCHRR